MRIVRGLPAVADVPLALTIGNFDGVHRGHQVMLERLCEAAEDLRLESAVLTFDPHPREYFARASNVASTSTSPRLSTVRAKAEYFAALGVSRMIVARFNAELAALSPVTFVDDILVRRLGARWILVGDDFRFGRARAGDISLLRGQAKTFTVEDMAPVKEEMLAAGYEILQSGHGYGAAGDGEFVYFDTLADFGTIFELIQIPKERREPDFVWPPAAS